MKCKRGYIFARLEFPNLNELQNHLGYLKKFMYLGLASLVAQLVKNLPAMQETLAQFWVRKIHWRRDSLPTAVFLGFPGGSDSKESGCNAGDMGLIPGLGRSPGGRHGNPLQYSVLTWRILMDRGGWWATIHGVAKVGQDWVTKNSTWR